jgi:hypothetical protein
MMEENLRRALLLSRGDWSVFVTRPLSAACWLAAALLLVIVLLPAIKNKREEAFVEDVISRPSATSAMRPASCWCPTARPRKRSRSGWTMHARTLGA